MSRSIASGVISVFSMIMMSLLASRGPPFAARHPAPDK
jgi:hypothetical protein